MMLKDHFVRVWNKNNREGKLYISVDGRKGETEKKKIGNSDFFQELVSV